MEGSGFYPPPPDGHRGWWSLGLVVHHVCAWSCALDSVLGRQGSHTTALPLHLEVGVPVS